jgi:hypothetical protein
VEKSCTKLGFMLSNLINMGSSNKIDKKTLTSMHKTRNRKKKLIRRKDKKCEIHNV